MIFETTLAIKLLQRLKKMKLKVLQSDDYYKMKKIDKKTLIKKSDIIIIGSTA